MPGEAEAARSASGAVVPRRRSHYEQRPSPEPAFGETVVVADAALFAQATEAQRGRQEPAEVSDAPSSTSALTARVPARLASDAHRRAPVQSPPRAASPISTPVETSLSPTAPAADSLPGRDGDKPPRQPPTSSAPARTPAVPSIGSVASVSPSPDQLPADQVAEPTPVSSSRAPVARGAAPPSTALQAESAFARRGEIAPPRQRDPAREVARASDARHAPLPAAPLAAPSVQVSIGRVEVRAVYAPPPSPARARAPAPTMSLDDYLKQREKGG